jgi:hypothetical protein
VSFRVVWELAALKELDDIWNAAYDKEGVKNTATRIDTELTFNPLEAGESRDIGFRVLFKYPLIVWFHVEERMREVHVLHVKAIQR